MSVTYGFEIEAKGQTRPLFTQVHGDIVQEVADPEAMRAQPAPGDGGYSFAKNVEISVFTADCFPLLFFTDNSIAAVHAGWRGMLAGIPLVALEKLKVTGDDYRLVIGPAILKCCFEVKDDFIAAFEQKGRPVTPFLDKREGKLFCRLDDFLLEALLADIPPAQTIAIHKRCTVCSSPQLPSYRRNKGTDPRIRSWIKQT